MAWYFLGKLLTSFAEPPKIKEAFLLSLNPIFVSKDMVGEQATMFFLDPAGNALEFKAFKDMDQLFAK
jgi:extradiol dioxygenase family protein